MHQSEYILALMPGQRVKFSAKMVGRFLDHKYLIRLCGEEVFKKQKAAGQQPLFISVDTLGGLAGIHSISWPWLWGLMNCRLILQITADLVAGRDRH